MCATGRSNDEWAFSLGYLEENSLGRKGSEEREKKRKTTGGSNEGEFREIPPVDWSGKGGAIRARDKGGGE